MVNTYITKKYKFLLQTAKNIVSSKRIKSNNIQEEASDLLAYTCEYMCMNRGRYDVCDDSFIESVMVNHMYRQWNWRNATAKKSYLHQTKMINEGPVDISELYIQIPEYDNKVEMEAENIPELAKDYILDLMNLGYSNENISKILFCKEYYKRLNVSEQSLYELYFIKQLSRAKISEMTKVPQIALQRMLTKIKKEIKNNYDKTI